MDKQGLLLCAKYSAAPNFFGYCGPPKNSNLVDHLREEIGDREVERILSEFDTLYLNLNLIAVENKIKDPFNQKVVEAYWLGNSLLNKIKNADYLSLLKEKFKLEKKIGDEKFGMLKYKFLTNKVLPQHAFHVFNIFKRTGYDPSFHTLQTMDNCRISWGEILQTQNSKFKSQNFNSKLKNKEKFISVLSRPLINVNGKLSLGNKMLRTVNLNYKDKTFFNNFKIGNFVSFHWGFVCDVLTPFQVRNLEFYTQKAIDFYNQSI